MPKVEVIGVRHDRDHGEEKHQQRPSQTTTTVPEEFSGPFPIIGRGQEVARYHEEEAHEEGAVDCEEGPQNRSPVRVLEIPPATSRSIGLAGMVSDNQDNEGDPQVVNEE